MTPRALILGVVLVLSFRAFDPAGPCSWECHNTGCQAGIDLVEQNLPAGPASSVEFVYTGTIQWLHDLPGTYRESNMLVYGIAFPLLGLILGLGYRPRWWIHGTALVSCLVLAVQPDWYRVCTEFMFKFGNLTGLTYAGANFLILILMMPLLLLTDFVFLMSRLFTGIRKNFHQKTN